MAEQMVTQLWMGSVMGVMLFIGIFAWVGYRKQGNHDR